MTADSNYKTLVGLIIQAEMDGKPRNELLLELGPTPASILQAGGTSFEALDLVLKAKTVGKMYFDHVIPRGVIERLPEILNAPKAIYRSANTSMAAVVVMTFEVQRGFPLIVPVHANKPIGRGRICNEVASMYAKEGENPEVKWRESGLLIWEAQKSPK